MSSRRTLGPTGIVWYGPTKRIGGYANASRAFLRALGRGGWRVRAVDLSNDHSSFIDDGSIDVVRALERVNAGPFPVEIVHYDPRACATLGSMTPAARVCATVFETMSIPRDWVRPLQNVDAVWVPTEFHRGTFAAAGVPAERIALVPFAIDTEFFTPREALPHERFRFVYASVWDRRKGVDVLLRSFVEEFDVDEPVELVLQTSIPDKTGDDAQAEALARIAAAVGNVPSDSKRRVTLHTKPLKQSEMRDLYASADLYISTDQNNIWTLPCIEALAMGKPCATTDYARATTWLSDENPLLIRCGEKLVDTDPELARLRPIYEGQKWATYDPSEVRRVMRWAFAHPRELAALAKTGREYVLRTHSIDAVARNLDDALALLRPRPQLRVKPLIARALKADATQPPGTKPSPVVDVLRPLVHRLRKLRGG